MKFDELMDDLVKKGLFGKVSAYMAVIEYQKRGLPHSHILLILDNDDKIKAIEDVDDFISAEIPPHPASITYPNDRLKEDRKAQDERLRKLVLTHMVHGPCGNEKPNSPCMFNSNGEATNICHKSFPKDYKTETEWKSSLYYPIYKRRSVNDGGSEALQNGRIINNSWIVPYNRQLLLKFNCHINCEICVSPKVEKYHYKYVYKGGDRASLRVDDNGSQILINEAKQFQDLKSFGAAESA